MSNKNINLLGILDCLFGSTCEQHNDWNKNWRETGYNNFRRSGNWKEADDWHCGSLDDHDGMFGFDSYEENDF